MGTQNRKDVTHTITRDLSGIVGDQASLKGDATTWLSAPEYGALQHRLENAHAAEEEVALVDACRRVRLDEARER